MLTLNRKTSRQLLGVMIILFVVSCSNTRTEESTGQYIDSSAITAKVKSALLSDPEVNGLQINVKTYKGVVELSGFVDNLREKQKAVAIVRKVPTVVSVRDALIVKPHIKNNNHQ